MNKCIWPYIAVQKLNCLMKQRDYNAMVKDDIPHLILFI